MDLQKDMNMDSALKLFSSFLSKLLTLFLKVVCLLNFALLCCASKVWYSSKVLRLIVVCFHSDSIFKVNIGPLLL